jgi:hypothetical protein
VLQEHPLSESHPQILPGLRGEGIMVKNKRVLPECLGSPSKRLRREGPSTNNKNTVNKHSEESSVSETSKLYLSTSGIINTIGSEKTTSSNIKRK